MLNRVNALIRCITLVFVLSSSLLFPISAEASTVVVNTTDDLADGMCDANHCSLREAIIVTNLMPGPDVIAFNLPSPGPYAIELLCDELPPVNGAGTVIDGTTQPGYSGIPMVEIRPVLPLNSVCPSPTRGLVLQGDDITVKGLSISGFRGDPSLEPAGIVISSGSGILLIDNFIGLDFGGLPNGNHIGVKVESQGQTIESNIIAANDFGLYLDAGDQTILGNLIGLEPTGNSSSGGYSNGVGIYIADQADGNTIGGPTSFQANTISGNHNAGIEIHADANAIVGNFIGTNRTGDMAAPNGKGISLQGNNNTIGGGAPGQGNLISGNTTGVFGEPAATGNQFFGNKIGTDSSGTTPLGNGHGIYLNWTYGDVIGGTGAGQGNLIAHNIGCGIFMHKASGVQMVGNTITANRDGIVILSELDYSCCDSISQNQIYGNQRLGIDLILHVMSLGVTPNDPGDADEGPNNLLNYPEFTSAGSSGVSGTACPGCTVELFLSDDDPSGHGEGMVFLDEAVADSSGNFEISLNFALAHCNVLTATATDSSGNTSEFSENVEIGLCLAVSWEILAIISLIPIFIGFVFGGSLGRLSRFPFGRTAAIGTVAGFVIGASILGLALALPGVQIGRPVTEPGAPAILPACDHLLTIPHDGPYPQVYESHVDPLFEWIPDEEMLPEGEIRWRVDMHKEHTEMQSRTTSETSLPLTAFDLTQYPIMPGSYYWRVTGEVAESEGLEFVPFCSPTHWEVIIILPPAFPPGPFPEPPGIASPTPTLTPTPTPTPPPQACIYEAIENVNCRSSDYKESDLIAILMKGEFAEILQVNPEYTHGKFIMEDQKQCWIWLGLMDGPVNPARECGVPVVDPPPPEIIPECSPDLDQEACEASGGTWSEGAAGAAECVCP